MLLFVYPGSQYTPEEKIYEMVELVINVLVQVYDLHAFNFKAFPVLIIVCFFGKDNYWFFIS